MIAGQAVLPRTTELGMPHVWDMVGRALEPASSIEGADPVWWAVVQASLVTLGTAGAGLLLGTVVGQAALDSLESEDLDLVGDGFEPIEVQLNEGGN